MFEGYREVNGASRVRLLVVALIAIHNAFCPNGGCTKRITNGDWRQR